MTHDEQTEMFENNINLIHYIVSRYWYGYINDEDFLQECYLRCWKSLDKFDDSLSTLSAYWTIIIKNVASTRNRKRTAKCRIPESAVFSLDFTYDNADEHNSPNNLYNYVIQYDSYIAVDLNNLYNQLSNMDITILELSMAGYTQKEICRITQLKQPTISRRLQKIRKTAEEVIL